MRISTTQLYSDATRNMIEGQSRLADIQSKIASGKNFTSLAEDPVAANQVVNLNRELAQLNIFQTNIDATRRRLELGETTLSNLNTALDRARDLSVQAASNTLTDSDRRAVSYELEQIVGFAANLMNTKDAKGEYVFSGGKGTTQTYHLEGGRYVYQGDSSTRDIQVGSSVFVQASESGQKIFESISGKAELSVTGAIASAIIDYEVTDTDEFRALTSSVGDIELSVSRTEFPLDGLSYSLLGSNGEPIVDAQGRVMSQIPYTESMAAPNTLRVALSGVDLTLSLPSDIDMAVEPQILPAASISSTLADSFKVTNPITAAAIFETLGPLTLDVVADLPNPGEFTYQLLDETGAVVNDAANNPISGSWDPQVPASEQAPDVVADLGGIQLSFTPIGVASSQATWSRDTDMVAGSFTITNQTAIETEFAELGPFSLEVSLDVDNGAPLLNEYSWRLVDKDTNTAFDINQMPVSGTFVGDAGPLTPIEAEFEGWSLDLSPLGYAGTQQSWSLEPSNQQPGILLENDTSGLLTQATLLDATDFTNFMQGSDTLIAAGDLQLSVEYDQAGGYTWSLLNSSGITLDTGNYDADTATSTTSNIVTTQGASGMELTFELPLDQTSYSKTLSYEAPLSARIRFEQDDTNILNALLDTIDVLRTPAQSDPQALAALNEQMSTILNQLNEAQGQIGDTWATIGARINSVDKAESSNIDFQLITQSTLSAVEDLDYAAASTELARKQLALEAAYASFAKIQGLSLFNYIN